MRLRPKGLLCIALIASYTDLMNWCIDVEVELGYIIFPVTELN